MAQILISKCSARESLATAELELLSSTSHNTSELWTKEGVVRQLGKAPILELIVYQTRKACQKSEVPGVQLQDRDRISDEYRIGDLADAHQDGVMWEYEPYQLKLLDALLKTLDFGIRPPKRSPSKLAAQPPNMTLNIHNAVASTRETLLFMALGIAMQSVALVIPAIMTYHWKKKKGDQFVQGYAYPTFLAASCVLITGIALCSHIIEATTVEQIFVAEKPYVKRIFQLQMACTMGDQTFDPYIIATNPRADCLRTSRSGSYNLARLGNDPRVTRAIRSQKRKTWLAIILSFLGFVGQFVGLRALHWSATVIQLGVTCIMTAVRARVRRGISRRPKNMRIRDDDPNRLAISLGIACQDDGFDDIREPWVEVDSPCLGPYTGGNTALETSDNERWPEWSIQDAQHNLITINDPRIQLRLKLQRSLPVDPELINTVNSLMRTMDTMFGKLNRRYQPNEGRYEGREIIWQHLIMTWAGPTRPPYSRLRLSLAGVTGVSIRRDDNEFGLAPLLTLWAYTIREQYRIDLDVSRPVIRCLEVLSEKDARSLKDSLQSYIGDISQYDCTYKPLYGPEKHLYKNNVRLPVFGMSRERVWYKVRDESHYGCLLASFAYPLLTQCALDILSGFVDALVQHVQEIHNSPLYNQSDIPVDYLNFAEKACNMIFKGGLVCRIEDAMMLVYPTFLRKRLIPPVHPGGGVYNASESGPFLKSIRNTNDARFSFGDTHNTTASGSNSWGSHSTTTESSSGSSE